jgi:peptidoglycan hydrolase CwlO-like protein
MLQMTSMMKPPPSGIEEYLKALTSKSDKQAGASTLPPPQTVNMSSILQAENAKMQQLQMQKQQLQAQLGQIDQQILKVQGGMEMLKRMAGGR